MHCFNSASKDSVGSGTTLAFKIKFSKLASEIWLKISGVSSDLMTASSSTAVFITAGGPIAKFPMLLQQCFMLVHLLNPTLHKTLVHKWSVTGQLRLSVENVFPSW